MPNAVRFNLKIFKNNRSECGFAVDSDEVIERFCESSFVNDNRRQLKVKLVLFIASKEGYDSTIARHSELVKLIKRYNLIYYKYREKENV